MFFAVFHPPRGHFSAGAQVCSTKPLIDAFFFPQAMEQSKAKTREKLGKPPKSDGSSSSADSSSRPSTGVSLDLVKAGALDKDALAGYDNGDLENLIAVSKELLEEARLRNALQVRASSVKDVLKRGKIGVKKTEQFRNFFGQQGTKAFSKALLRKPSRIGSIEDYNAGGVGGAPPASPRAPAPASGSLDGAPESLGRGGSPSPLPTATFGSPPPSPTGASPLPGVSPPGGVSDALSRSPSRSPKRKPTRTMSVAAALSIETAGFADSSPPVATPPSVALGPHLALGSPKGGNLLRIPGRTTSVGFAEEIGEGGSVKLQQAVSKVGVPGAAPVPASPRRVVVVGTTGGSASESLTSVKDSLLSAGTAQGVLNTLARRASKIAAPADSSGSGSALDSAGGGGVKDSGQSSSSVGDSSRVDSRSSLPLTSVYGEGDRSSIGGVDETDGSGLSCQSLDVGIEMLQKELKRRAALKKKTPARKESGMSPEQQARLMREKARTKKWLRALPEESLIRKTFPHGLPILKEKSGATRRCQAPHLKRGALRQCLADQKYELAVNLIRRVLVEARPGLLAHVEKLKLFGGAHFPFESIDIPLLWVAGCCLDYMETWDRSLALFEDAIEFITEECRDWLPEFYSDTHVPKDSGHDKVTGSFTMGFYRAMSVKRAQAYGLKKAPDSRDTSPKPALKQTTAGGLAGAGGRKAKRTISFGASLKQPAPAEDEELSKPKTLWGGRCAMDEDGGASPSPPGMGPMSPPSEPSPPRSILATKRRGNVLGGLFRPEIAEAEGEGASPAARAGARGRRNVVLGEGLTAFLGGGMAMGPEVGVQHRRISALGAEVMEHEKDSNDKTCEDLSPSEKELFKRGLEKAKNQVRICYHGRSSSLCELSIQLSS